MVSKGRKRVAKLHTKTPILLTEGKGEDEKEEAKEEESKEEEVPLKEKGKVTITKPIIFEEELQRRNPRKKKKKYKKIQKILYLLKILKVLYNLKMLNLDTMKIK